MFAWPPPADGLGDVGAVTEPAGVTGGNSDECRHVMIFHLAGTFKTRMLSSVLGQDTLNHHQQSQFKAVHPQNPLTWVAGGQSEDVKKAGETAQPGITRNNLEAATDGNAAGGGEETDGTTGGH